MRLSSDMEARVAIWLFSILITIQFSNFNGIF